MGFEYSKAARSKSKPALRGSLDQFVEVAQLKDMPSVPLTWLESAIPRMSAADRDLMLRHKIVPYVWLPHCVVHGVASTEARALAARLGLHVVGRVQAQHYRYLVRKYFAAQLLRTAVSSLRNSSPWASAQRRLTTYQIAFMIAAIMTAVLGATVWGASFAWAGIYAAASIFFLLVVGLRCLCHLPMPQGRGVVAPLLSDEALPVYTVLVPLFREVSVLRQLIAALNLLSYPTSKLDIKIILEEGDMAMHRSVAALMLPDHFDVIVVPSGYPQTKPRALNFAMQFARGSCVTIFDSEDIPQPNQLRLAAAQLAASSAEVACLQASLEFYNPNENWLTRQFTAEYAALFHVILPTLAAYRMPLLLGGTSNHFRTSALKTVGGWDPYNVTEDADLGIRLARFGFKTGILHSTTYEEANLEIWNWMKQRRRWLKGFLMTWLVHNRNPLLLLRELGLGGFLVVQSMTLGIFVSALLHPPLLVATIWSMLPQQVALTTLTPLGSLLSGLGLLVLVAGYTTAIATSSKGLKQRWQVWLGGRTGHNSCLLALDIWCCLVGTMGHHCRAASLAQNAPRAQPKLGPARGFSFYFWPVTVMTDGPRMTMKMIGKKNKIIGTVNFGGSAAAFLSASAIRVSRFSCAKTRNAVPSGVP